MVKVRVAGHPGAQKGTSCPREHHGTRTTAINGFKRTSPDLKWMTSAVGCGWDGLHPALDRWSLRPGADVPVTMSRLP
jgi:hypothetical protein